jgi:hypothetical protein
LYLLILEVNVSKDTIDPLYLLILNN